MGAVACASCGTALRESAKFCDECGSSTTVTAGRAEYKQVTVLFADVVRRPPAGLHRDRRASRDGSADGVGRPVRWRDAQ